MSPQNRKASYRKLAKLCKERGLDLIVTPQRGGGSHEDLTFRDTKSGEEVSVTVAAHTEISPGVQRNIKKYVKSREGIDPICRTVLEILEIVFG